MKQDDGYCTIQEYNEMKTSIFDAIDEWQKYWDSDASTGIAINPTTHGIEVCTKEDAPSGTEWYELESLVEDGEASADKVLELVDSFCFLR